MKPTLVALLSLVLIVSTAAAAEKKHAPPPLRVYVFTVTDPSGFIDQQTKGRQDAVAQTKLWITAMEKKRFVVVEDRETADLVLEITGLVTQKETNSLAVMSNALNPKRPQVDTDVRRTYRLATLTVGDYSTELRAGLGARSGLVDPLKRWVELNAAKIQPSGAK